MNRHQITMLLVWAATLPATAQTAAPATAASAPVAAVDHAAIDRTQIIGNKELPKVLYIVPWKKPLPDPLSGRPRASLLDEVLAPLDRAEFRRQLSYRDQVSDPSSQRSPSPQEKAP
ncbi:MAG: hypothetical protein OEU93_10645 [Rubrivivax sp.]|nr:hypothetical protein [Rubrivivax sp.]